MKLKIGISPCPNDTYIFEAIFQQQACLPNCSFDFVFEDVETLNEMAARQELDIVKISYANYFNVMRDYILLKSGGAMGQGVGPLLISRQIILPEAISDAKIAIPGFHTTAHFLLSFAFPDLTHKQALRFDQIEDAVLKGEADAGVIIHENRFTYADKGLHKIMDLGTYWETSTGLPIPLGAIAIRRSLPPALQQEVNELVKESIRIADLRPTLITPFIREHAREMKEEVMAKHIDLYVNAFSKDVGTEGLQAVEKMRQVLKVQSQYQIFI
jgi:1,4-dihydroxy-6-naphthoate synthase